MDDHDIELIFLGVDTHPNPWNPISEETVIAALKLILNPDNYPLHVMCGLGRHKTGLNTNIIIVYFRFYYLFIISLYLFILLQI